MSKEHEIKTKKPLVRRGEKFGRVESTGGEIFPGGGSGMDKLSAGEGVGKLPSIPPSRENPAKWVYYSSSHV